MFERKIQVLTFLHKIDIYEKGEIIMNFYSWQKEVVLNKLSCIKKQNLFWTINLLEEFIREKIWI